MNVSAAVKGKVAAKINECIATIEKHYKIKFKPPHVRYDVRGTVAGYASPRKWEVRFNPVLLMENLDDFIARTVPHEIAHLACDQLYPDAHKGSLTFQLDGRIRRNKREIHGPRWRSIMAVLGADDSRCHNYDVSNARVKRSRSTSVMYKCSKCGIQMPVGAKSHARAQQGSVFWHRGCGNRKWPLVLATATGTPVQNIPAPTRQPIIKKYASKQEHALALFKANPSLSRSEMIKLIINATGTTKAGASTYYYNCQKQL